MGYQHRLQKISPVQRDRGKNLPIMQLLVLCPGAGQDSKYVVEEEVDVGNSKFCIYLHAAEHSVYPDLGWPIRYAVNYFV